LQSCGRAPASMTHHQVHPSARPAPPAARCSDRRPVLRPAAIVTPTASSSTPRDEGSQVRLDISTTRRARGAAARPSTALRPAPVASREHPCDRGGQGCDPAGRP
jgi:hypothetical protein